MSKPPQLDLPTNVINLVHISIFIIVVKKLVHSVSFNLADLNWPKELSTSSRYLFSVSMTRLFYGLMVYLVLFNVTVVNIQKKPAINNSV